MGCGSPQGMGYPSYLLPVICYLLLPLLSPIPVLQSAASVFLVWPHRLIVS